VEEPRESGQTYEVYARANGFSGESFSRWRGWFKRSRAELPTPIEVLVRERETVPVVEEDDCMDLEVSQQRLVHLGPGFNRAAVARLGLTLEQL
jgi:hypothetical protein